MLVIWPVLVVEVRISETFAPSNTGILRIALPESRLCIPRNAFTLTSLGRCYLLRMTLSEGCEFGRAGAEKFDMS